MSDEPDTLDVESGTDNVNPSADDTGSEWDFYDPEEDQDTVESTQEEATEDEEGEPEEQPSEDSEEEPDQQEEPEVKLANDTDLVRLSDGTETTVAELTKGHLRQSDYTRKSQELAQRREAIAADATRAEQITNALVDHLSSMIPDAPDASLAYTDPNRFTAMRAQHEAAVARVQEFVQVAQEAKGVSTKLSEEDMQAKIQKENLALAERFPQTAAQDGRKSFFDNAMGAALDLGFTEAEVKGQTDHRILGLAYYAKIGMEAERAKETAKAKVTKVAPTPAKKPGQVRGGKSNRAAMQKLAKSGSLKDALNVDYDF